MNPDDLSAAIAGLARILLPLSREDRSSVLFLSRWLEGAPHGECTADIPF